MTGHKYDTIIEGSGLRGANLAFGNVDRLVSDLVCTPMSDPTLPAGLVTATFKVMVKDVKTDASLVNLFMGESSLFDLVEEYSKRNNVKISNSFQTANAMKALFPDIIQATYPQGIVESKATPGFIKPILQTIDLPIIGYVPAEIGGTRSSGFAVKLALENMDTGIITDPKIYLQLPEGIELSERCKTDYVLDFSEQKDNFNYKLQFNPNYLTGLRKGMEPSAITSCSVITKKITTINPNVPEPKTFKARVD
jgi:hypothetical protein